MSSPGAGSDNNRDQWVPPARDEIYRRLLSPGERLGWYFRDRHQFWRHWPEPAPVQIPNKRLLWLLGMGVVGGLVYLLSLTGMAGTGNPAGAFLLWIVLIGPALGLAIYHAFRPLATGTGVSFAQRTADWQARRDQYNAQERIRIDALDEWGAMTTVGRSRRTDVFGGDRIGWASFLTTFGTSMLGEEPPVVVADLSRSGVSGELCLIASDSGISCRVELLPDHIDQSLLMAGLSPDDVKDVLVEAIHGDHPESGRDDRVIDDRILGAICKVLSPNPTPARIHEALRRLLREPELRPNLLTEDEFARIPSLFAPEYISNSHGRLQRLEAYIANFARLSPTAAALPAEQAQLTCLAVGQSGSQAFTEFLIDLVGQWLIRNMKNMPQGSVRGTTIVVGADSLKPRHLDELGRLADHHGCRVALLFRNLRETGAQVLGAGRSTVFMRLGSAEEASRAADFIGRGYKFELSQVTRGHGETDTQEVGESVGGEPGLFGLLQMQRSWGRSWSRSHSTNWNYAETQQRVYELYVEPTQLQGLPTTAILLVQHLPDNRIFVAAGDCNPDILSLPRVSVLPLPEPTALASESPDATYQSAQR